MKITVIGAGNVGATIAQRIVDNELVNEIILVDVVEGMPQGKGQDMSESAPIGGSDTKVIGTNSYEQTADSDIIFITAGIARNPGMTRDDLQATNAKIVKTCTEQVVKFSPKSIIIVVSNPLDVMTYVALKASGFDRYRVIGMAGILDSSRFRKFISMELNVSVQDVSTFVLGSHGDSMVPLPRYSTVAGIPLPELMDKETIDRLVKRTRDAGVTIVNLLKTGSAFYAPSASAVQIVEAILKDRKRILPCAVFLQGEYGIQDTVIGVPIKLGKDGMEQIIQIKLSAEEQAELNKSAAKVRANMDKVIF
jgi:malate dehydrogenase